MPRVRMLQATAIMQDGELRRLKEHDVVEVDDATAERWERIGLADATRAKLSGEGDEHPALPPTPPGTESLTAPANTGQSARAALRR